MFYRITLLIVFQLDNNTRNVLYDQTVSKNKRLRSNYKLPSFLKILHSSCKGATQHGVMTRPYALAQSRHISLDKRSYHTYIGPGSTGMVDHSRLSHVVPSWCLINHQD